MKKDAEAEQLRVKLADPVWRLSNLYAIKDAETGREIPFEPRPEQLQVFGAVHRKGIKRIIILKARRLGMSTGIDVLATDLALFSAGVQVSIVDQTQDDASKKLTTICKVAFAGMPKSLRESFEVTRDNDSTWEVTHRGGDQTSAIYAGKNARGGTNQLLHVSEWGVIQAADHRRSEEILTGGLPSAEHGVIIVETTWKGGKGGHLWDLVKPAMETPDSEKTSDDWHIFFFPWWVDPTYTSSATDIPEDIEEYLNDLELTIGRKLTPGQRSWYARRRRELGIFIFREFPSTLDECFRAPIEGAIYAERLDALRADGRIARLPIDPKAPVHTFWDLGSPKNTVVWYAQMRGRDIRVIDVESGLDLTAQQRAEHMLAKGYDYGYHYLPHDARQTERSGQTFQSQVEEAGLTGCRIVPRTSDVWVGINHLREMLPRMSFRQPACESGIEALTSYHTRKETSSGRVVDIPEHDWSSHWADALRTMAEADLAGMLDDGTAYAEGLGAILDVARGHVAGRMVLSWLAEARSLDALVHAEGWLRYWESPAHERRYLVSVCGESVLVLRDGYRDDRMRPFHLLVAADCGWSSERVDLVSRWYARAPVAYAVRPKQRKRDLARIEMLKARAVPMLRRRRMGEVMADLEDEYGFLADGTAMELGLEAVRERIAEGIDIRDETLVTALRTWDGGEDAPDGVTALAIGLQHVLAGSVKRETFPTHRRPDRNERATAVGEWT